MEPLAATAQMKELDRRAIQERGIPSLALMERAAAGVAHEVQLLLDRASSGRRRVALFCGPGNNGGDGIAAARLLREAGEQVRAFLVGDRGKMTPDAKAMEERLVESGGALEDYLPENQEQRDWLLDCVVMVDALFGVGLSRPVAGAFLTAIQTMNASPCPVVACDIPSGVEGDTGAVLGEAVHATVTVTFTLGKPGLWLAQGGACAGEVHVLPIGIPEDLVAGLATAAWVWSGYDARLPRRPRTAHKGSFGKILILAGCEGYTGAPVLAARAAVRGGAGLVFLGVPRNIYPIVAVKCDEAMPFPMPEEYEVLLDRARGCDAVLIGPGLGQGPEIRPLVLRLLTDLEIPVVLDADGINALAGHIDVLDKRSAPTILTPHDGEFQRLTGCALPIEDRLSAAREFAAAHSCVLVLKGRGTVTADPEGAVINTSGNPGMAKGGSGDVLAGLLTGLLGQRQLRERYRIPDLAAMAVYLHGAAGDLCARKLGEYAMTPSDMLSVLPQVLGPMEAGEQQRHWKETNP